jgi:L-alanine-DL-glutamate epimerase-like enolase superfamily enzyme
MGRGDVLSRIASIKLGCVYYGDRRPALEWGGVRVAAEALVVLLRSDCGAFGLGVTWLGKLDARLSLAAADEVLAATLLGGTATLPFAAAARVAALGFDHVSAATEAALYDLAGRLLQVPAYHLLGARREQAPSYVISADEFSFTRPEQYVELAERYVQAGFRACKFHLWGDARRDVPVCAAIREAVGPDVALMLDPASRYGRQDALHVGRAIEELGFVRFEDPISMLDKSGYRWLSPRVNVPIFVNDSERWNIGNCAEAARDGLIQGLRFNVGRAGLVGGLAMGALAEATGVEFDVAGFAPRGGLEACLHLGLASQASRWFEHHELARLEEVPGIAPGYAIEAGTTVPSGRAGLGCDVDLAELESHCTWAR